MPGILPYSQNQGEIYVLLSQEKYGKDKQKWDHFSGGKESFDRTNADAAAREGAEESCQLFGGSSTIKKNMKPLNSGDNTFMLKVPFEEKINKRFQGLKKLNRFKAKKYQEKSKVKWVKLATVIDAAVNKKGVFQHGNQRIEFRPYFTKLIQRNAKYFRKLEQQLKKPKPHLQKPNSTGEKAIYAVYLTPGLRYFDPKYPWGGYHITMAGFHPDHGNKTKLSAVRKDCGTKGPWKPYRFNVEKWGKNWTLVLNSDTLNNVTKILKRKGFHKIKGPENKQGHFHVTLPHVKTIEDAKKVGQQLLKENWYLTLTKETMGNKINNLNRFKWVDYQQLKRF